MPSSCSAESLDELVKLIRWRWPLILLITACFVAGATIYVSALPSLFDGTSVVAFAPRAGVVNAGADTVSVVAPKYVAYILAPRTAASVARRVGVDEKTIANSVSANIANATGIVTITVRLPSASRAAEAANAFAEEAVRLSRGDRLLNGQQVVHAVAPQSAAAPPRHLFQAGALLGGLVFALGITVLLDRMRPRLRGLGEDSEVEGYRVVGEIRVPRSLRLGPKGGLADAHTGRALRRLRANLAPRVAGTPASTALVVTSPRTHDGKTAVAAMLAEAFARVGRGVLLVDGDLIRPRLGKIVQPSARGLGDLLRGEVSLESATGDGWVEGLEVMTTDADTEAVDIVPAGFSRVLDDVRERSDLVIIDAPPVIGDALGLEIVREADGVLLVVPERPLARDVTVAIRSVEGLNGPALLGLVIAGRQNWRTELSIGPYWRCPERRR